MHKKDQENIIKPEEQGIDERIEQAAEQVQTSAKRFFFRFLDSQRLSQTRQAIVLNELAESSAPGFDFLVLIILSCTIATLGLVTNSAAVIIGAMLVAPLMSPILGLSMASLTGRPIMFRRSLFSVLEGASTAILLSSLLAYFTYRLPYGILAELPSEVLSRTSPSPLDLIIALAGGVAAAFALGHPKLSAALPGVAIATALMPPLCTVGIGIAFNEPNVVLGALLLFLTNLSSISFAGILTFALLGFRPKSSQEKKSRIPRSIRISALLVLLITIPLAFLAWKTIREANLYNQVNNVLVEGLSQYTDVQLVDLSIRKESQTQRLTVTIRSANDLSHQQVLELQEQVAQQFQQPTSLEIIRVPMQRLDALTPPTPTVTPQKENTPTHTPMPTSTPRPTPTYTPQPTPIPAFIIAPDGVAQLFDAPEGNLIAQLPDGSPVWVLADQQELNGVVWRAVLDIFDRQGWLPQTVLTITLLD